MAPSLSCGQALPEESFEESAVLLGQRQFLVHPDAPAARDHFLVQVRVVPLTLVAFLVQARPAPLPQGQVVEVDAGLEE
jgi:hypothetical protein